jgi:hypothetical protein
MAEIGYVVRNVSEFALRYGLSDETLHTQRCVLILEAIKDWVADGKRHSLENFIEIALHKHGITLDMPFLASVRKTGLSISANECCQAKYSLLKKYPTIDFKIAALAVAKWYPTRKQPKHRPLTAVYKKLLDEFSVDTNALYGSHPVIAIRLKLQSLGLQMSNRECYCKCTVLKRSLRTTLKDIDGDIAAKAIATWYPTRKEFGHPTLADVYRNLLTTQTQKEKKEDVAEIESK